MHRAIYARRRRIACIWALCIYCHICICAPRDHETRRLASRRSAAGMSRRRFDLKVELQAIRPPFDLPAPATFVKRSRAIPTFGCRQAPWHENRLRGSRNHTKIKGHRLPMSWFSFVKPARALSCAAKAAFVSGGHVEPARARRMRRCGRDEVSSPRTAQTTHIAAGDSTWTAGFRGRASAPNALLCLYRDY